MKSTVMDKANQLACTTQCVDSLIAFGQWLKRGLAGSGFAIPPLCVPRATNSKGSCLLYIAIHVVRSEIIYTLKWKLFPIENGNHFVHSRDKVCIINSSRSHLVSIAINCITYHTLRLFVKLSISKVY